MMPLAEPGEQDLRRSLSALAEVIAVEEGGAGRDAEGKRLRLFEVTRLD